MTFTKDIFGYIMMFPAIAVLAFALLTGCDNDNQALSSTAPIPKPAHELVFYEWKDEMPEKVLNDFTREYGVMVTNLSYSSVKEAVANLESGKVYDVVVINSNEVPRLIQKGLLAKLNHGQIKNFKNIAANFRDLFYDPGNRYSIPFCWGTIGLAVRNDLVGEPVTRWIDLWDVRYAGRSGFWLDMPREVIAIALKSLGYSANSEEPSELEHALRHLEALKPHMVRLEEVDPMVSTGVMSRRKSVVAMAWARDVLEGREKNPSIDHVLPDEGALLWGDSLIIPANSPNQYTARVFIDYLLRPDVNARIANKNRYATPNEAAMPLIDPAIRNDPVVFPSNDDLQNAELILPLSPEGQILHERIWKTFLQNWNGYMDRGD